MKQKGKGMTFIALETLSLAMTFVSMSGINTAQSKYTDSYNIYKTSGEEGSEIFQAAKDQYLSDYNKYQSAQLQFYSATVSSLAVWVYNIYDIRKQRYNYSGTKSKSILNVSFSPDSRITFRINF